MPNYRITHPLWIETLNSKGESVVHAHGSVVSGDDIFPSSIPHCLADGWIAETEDPLHEEPIIDHTAFPNGWCHGDPVPGWDIPLAAVAALAEKLIAAESAVQEPREDAPNPDHDHSILHVDGPIAAPENEAPAPEATAPAPLALEAPPVEPATDPAHEGTV